MNKISAVVLTKNSAKVITRCLNSLRWCDEIVIIDDNSTDNTRNIARKLGVVIFSHKLNNNFARQRSYGLKVATNDWLLYVDSDEEVTNKLAIEIKAILKDPQFVSYKIPRSNIFLNKKLNGGEWGGNRIIRLVRKGHGKWVREVHEYWDTQLPVGNLKNYLLHYSPVSISLFLHNLRFYIVSHAKENAKEGKIGTFWKILFYPPAKFIQNYIVLKGYRDGIHGFVMAVLMSLHSFLSWCYLWSYKR